MFPNHEPFVALTRLPAAAETGTSGRPGQAVRMRIAYVCHWNPFVEDGVVRKIRSQTNAWRRFGVEVEVFCLSSESARDARTPPLQGRHFLYREPYAGRARATLRLSRAAVRWRPDVVYLRYSLFFPPPVHLMRAVPTVVEINSDDRVEYRHRSRALGLYNAFNRRVLFREAKGLACITPELVSRVAPDATRLATVHITNGISLDEGDALAPAENVRPRLVFLGAPEAWHGLDKIVWLAGALPEFDFDVVGTHERLNQPTPPNVRFHGFCERPEYEAILAASDVALGTLALHRNGMSEAAPLKVREYLLRGIPIVIGYKDPDLEDKPWFVLQLPNTENNVRDAVGEIRDFVLSVAGRRVGREEVSTRIDTLVKERERLDFLEEIARGSLPSHSATGRGNQAGAEQASRGCRWPGHSGTGVLASKSACPRLGPDG